MKEYTAAEMGAITAEMDRATHIVVVRHHDVHPPVGWVDGVSVSIYHWGDQLSCQLYMIAYAARLSGAFPGGEWWIQRSGHIRGAIGEMMR